MLGLLLLRSMSTGAQQRNARTAQNRAKSRPRADSTNSERSAI